MASIVVCLLGLLWRHTVVYGYATQAIADRLYFLLILPHYLLSPAPSELSHEVEDMTGVRHVVWR